MSSAIRVCLFDEFGSDSGPFAAPFEKIDQIEIVGTFKSWDSLQATLLLSDVDVVAVNLDGPGSLDVVARVGKLSHECPVIGISTATEANGIIKAMRAGCAQYVCSPVDVDDLRNAVLRIRPSRLRGSHTCKRVCVIGSSGGSGATTIACNLAMELAHLTERRTALIDLNLEYGDVCCAFDCAPKYSIADICGENVELDHDTLGAALHDLPCNVSVLARPQNIEDARQVTPEGLEQMFRLLAERFGYIIADLPRSYSFLSAVAVGRAEATLIVAQLAVPFIRNASRIYECLLQMGADPERVHVLLNRCNAEYERLTLKDVENHFRKPVFGVVPNDYEFVSAALDLGHPIGADSPTSKARAAIQDIARKLAPEAIVVNPRGQSSGLLNKLLGRKPKAAAPSRA
ncbi:MAG: hypothetical protein HOP29_19365 [Phycisphaerales bacterium]|nr:hypothetical protein [Phycisphaerales bacterium]